MTTPTDTAQPFDLDAIRARAAHVIAGPWAVGEPRCVDEVDAWEIPIHLPSVVDGKPDERGEFAVVRYQTAGFHYPHGEAIADAEFIAAAREDIPALLAEVERLRGEVARMSAVVDTARTWRHGVVTSGEECSTYALACAVDALDERSGR